MFQCLSKPDQELLAAMLSKCVTLDGDVELNVDTCVSLDWSPICIDGVQWYVANLSTDCDGTDIVRLWRQGAEGVATVTQPAGTLRVDGYCETGPDREAFCYLTEATGDEVQHGWARHDDSLVGVVAPHVSPNGIAYFDFEGNPEKQPVMKWLVTDENNHSAGYDNSIPAPPRAVRKITWYQRPTPEYPDEG